MSNPKETEDKIKQRKLDYTAKFNKEGLNKRLKNVVGKLRNELVFANTHHEKLYLKNNLKDYENEIFPGEWKMHSIINTQLDNMYEDEACPIC